MKVLLVIGSGSRIYREYLLSSAAERHAVWLLDVSEPTWQAPYIAGHTVVPLLDPARLIPDSARLLAAADEVAARHRVVGVLCYDETQVVTATAIAERLGLPSLGGQGVDRCRNKHRTRRTLTEAGLVQPRFALVQTVDVARAVAGAFGYPVVLKPRGMGASIGVVRVNGPAELEHGFRIAEAAGHEGAPAYEGGVLVEEFLTGPEISVDGAVVGGGYTPFCLAHKRIGLAPFMEEIGHLVDPADPLLADAGLRDVLTRAHRALGLQDGITHTELKLTPRGPAIIEVNARLGGDLIPYLGRLASGIDPAHVAVDVATGVRPSFRRTWSRVTGIRFRYPSATGRVRSVQVPGPSDGLLEARPMVAAGDTLFLPPDGYLARYAYLIATGRDVAACEQALDAAEARTTVDLDALLAVGDA